VVRWLAGIKEDMSLQVQALVLLLSSHGIESMTRQRPASRALYNERVDYGESAHDPRGRVVLVKSAVPTYRQ
jgi:hypothetical protein